MAENERLIADIMGAQQRLQHLFAYDRSDPLFASQLTHEKGLETLLAAWETIGSSIPLKIVGDGPLAEMVANAAARIPGSA